MRNKTKIPFKLVTILAGLALLNSGCDLVNIILTALDRACRTGDWTITRAEEPSPSTCTPEDCSLRQAITISNACHATTIHTLHIQPGVYTLAAGGAGEDRNRSGDLDITYDINFVGEGVDGEPVISGDLIDRVLDVMPGANVHITGFSFQNGRADFGGGIRNQGTLEIHDSWLENNAASAAGGGIYSTGNLIFYGSNVSYNTAGSYGGGIAVDGRSAAAPITFEFRFSSTESNTAVDGGGIYIGEQVDANLMSGNIQSNQASARGGGIYNTGAFLNGTILLIRSNMAGQEGGGLSNYAQANLSRVAITDNHADGSVGANGGGGLFNQSTGQMHIDNSTISGNESNITGGGIANSGSLNITFSTIADNRLDGMNLSSDSILHISNSIVANNAFDCSIAGASLISDGFNIDGGHTCDFTQTSDLSDTDPFLLIVGDNGGGTLTHALAPSSPAIDSADPSVCGPTDQRAIARPFDGNGDGNAVCDRGAYEYTTASASAPLVAASATPTLTPTSSPSLTPTAAQAIPFTLILVQNANCRLGPGTVYESVDAFPAGQSLLVDGRNEMAPWWWQVQLPTNTRKHCWVSSASGQPQGDPQLLPAIQVAPPAGPSSGGGGGGGAGAPAAPSKLAIISRQCTSKKYSVTLGWQDNATNETGYRVYRNGALIATLGPNAASYSENPPGSGPYTYSVEAFNAAGVSAQISVNEEGCLI